MYMEGSVYYICLQNKCYKTFLSFFQYIVKNALKHVKTYLTNISEEKKASVYSQFIHKAFYRKAT